MQNIEEAKFQYESAFEQAKNEVGRQLYASPPVVREYTRYLRIIKGKTAALFEASFFTGAALAEKDRHIIDKYAKLGHNVGMIFQLIDDCMDFEETEAAAKKPVQSDYEQNVITLPLIRAFEKLPELKKKAKKHKLSRKEINGAVYEYREYSLFSYNV